jgi:midasin (ATPase involved in ribosome maturation)
MQEGKPIILDEANLLNSAVLARLQSVLDNTDKVTDRGQDIAIKDGFKVIMTMNLETNLGKTPLPNPLVSRAIELIDFDLDPAFKDKTANYIW